MTYFDTIFLGKQSYNAPGYFDIVDSVIVVDCDELKKLFDSWYRTGTTFNEIEFYNSGELVKGFTGEYIIDSVHLNEAEFVKV